MKSAIPFAILVVASAAGGAEPLIKSRELVKPSPLATEGILFAQSELPFISPVVNEHPMNRLFASAMCTGGVAVGDVDGDGRPDLFFVNGPKENALFLQTGDFAFTRTDAGLDGGENWGVGAALVDIDQDGDLDVFVCNHESANELHINMGKGKDGKLKFSEEAAKRGLDQVDASHTPAFADYDNDGDIDLYLMTNKYYNPDGVVSMEEAVERGIEHPQIREKYAKYLRITKMTPAAKPGVFNIEVDKKGTPDILLRNDGGRFVDVTVSSGLLAEDNMGLSATWWDYDSDGRLDLYIANDFEDPDHFYRNEGGGKFRNVIVETVPHTTWASMGADFGDLNGDGMPDFLIADMFGSTHFKQKVGMGSMSGKAEFLTTAIPRQYMRNALYVNTGTGRFMECGQMPRMDRTDWTWAVLIRDFDNDGRNDVYFTNGMSGNYNDSDITEQRKGETEWQRRLRMGLGALREANVAFRQTGPDFDFEKVSAGWGLDHTGVSMGAVSADLDRDGDLDLVVVNFDEPVFLYRNQSQAGNRVLLEFNGTLSEKHGLGCIVDAWADDLRLTDQVVMMRGYAGCHEPVVHLGLGESKKIDRLKVRWPSGHIQEFKDLAAGRFYTITEPKAAPAKPKPEPAPQPLLARRDTGAEILHRETPVDDFLREPLLPNKLSQLGPGLAAGDVDGDGDDDVYQGGAAGQPRRIFANDGKGNFAPLPPSPALDADEHCEDLGALFFDADGDGDADLYVVSGGVECDPQTKGLQDRLYLNDGKGGFTRPAGNQPAEMDSGSCVAAADFDRDGDLDLFVGSRVVPGSYPAMPTSHLLINNGKAEWTDAGAGMNLDKVGLVTGALWSDADDDGWIDLLVTTEWGPVKYFRNENGRLSDRTKEAGLSERTGWWNGIAGRDIDGDGDIDYCVTNFGLNTKYHASPEHPAMLFYGDFDGTGRRHLVEAEFENDTIFPVRGKSCSSAAMPFLKSKFDTYKKFAVASLTDIYPEEKLKGAERFAATELQSGLLINDGKANFTFKALPRLAQISPGFTPVMTDLNADGNTDILMTQNFWTPQPETGRMDGGMGLLMLGDGKGGFQSVWPKESGFHVWQDAKSMIEGDFDSDGAPDYLISVNDGALQAYRATASGQWRVVRLHAKPGHPIVAGARITAEMPDGRKLAAEVSAGSGYLSGSAGVLFFPKPTKNVSVRWPGGKLESLAAK